MDLCVQNAGKVQALFPRAIERILVARIGVSHHAAGRVVPQHPLQTLRRLGLAPGGRIRIETRRGAIELAARADRPCILIGREDVVFHAPPRLALDLAAGTRVSLFPLRPVTGQSTGLRWPIHGIDFTPGGRVGTSNEALATEVKLEMDGPGMLVILPRDCLDAAVRAVLAAGSAPSTVRA